MISSHNHSDESLYYEWDQKHNIILHTANMKGALILHIPSALGVTGDVMFKAVLLNLKHMIKGSIQFLHRHLNGTLHTSEDSYQQSQQWPRRGQQDPDEVLTAHQFTPLVLRQGASTALQLLVTEACFYTRMMCLFAFLRVCARLSKIFAAIGGLQPSASAVLVWSTHMAHSLHTLCLNAHHIFLSARWCVVLTDLQLQHIPLPVEGKTAKEFHHSALVSEREELKTRNRCRKPKAAERTHPAEGFQLKLVPSNQRQCCQFNQ